jgi:hypothetical protein
MVGGLAHAIALCAGRCGFCSAAREREDDGMRAALKMAIVLGMAWAITTAHAQEVVASGLNNPMGVMIGLDGTLWVVDSGYGGDMELELVDPMSGETMMGSVGMTSRVLTIGADGSETVRAMLPSVAMGFETVGGSRMARLGTHVYVTSGAWQPVFGPEPMPMMATVVRVAGEDSRVVADLYGFEEAENPDDLHVDSNPYGIVGGSDGMLYVTDSGANTLLRVDPRSGRVSLVAVFEGLPGPFPNPGRGGAMEMDPVPTGVVQAPDGTFYVALLPGFPFPPGAAAIVRVDRAGTVTPVVDGLTMVTDLAMAPNGDLYVVTIALFTEQGPQPFSGSVTRVSMTGAHEVVVDGLMFPTALAFAANGDLYVTQHGLGAPGTGEVLRYAGLGSR